MSLGNNELIVRRHRKEPLELQLTAMIDIFSMIVIFLIFGTVFGAADIVVPGSIKVPKSVSKEGAESAPRLVLDANEVMFSGSGEKAPLSWFKGQDEDSRAKADAFKGRIREYVAKLPESAKGSGVLLNVIADQDTPYEDVFSVIRVFREAGFQSLLFVATGEGKAK